ncbi:four-carbon acid sugar kinase family protein [Billgrantia diversa]|uniref:four-carbon acid sugar kinase family protein n=1 Tax=Halomonas sp. MCCC 1A13316 TaxID=2733487 RepID=UPI0018A4453B|nr:four-carbon acid sugar kinase family protein [Halomonas sp. MCCC 1A13316]QOR38992.1 four-carbon acid sugar kinase family protein [Halomonas sp. MCCC 1A13316]
MSTGCDIAIVADDLTGALDAAAPFAERGMSTRVAVTLEGLEAALGGDEGAPRVVSVNTGSRHLGRDAAARRAGEAAERLLAQRPRLLLKKVDSTLRGQVVAEAAALRHLAGQRRLLVCPAVPSQGRCVLGGEVWVEGEPLSATAYARDGLSPALTGPLRGSFAAGGVSLVRHVAEAGQPLPMTDCVVDATDDPTLTRIAEQLLEAPGDWLPVCAAGLTQALARSLALPKSLALSKNPTSTRCTGTVSRPAMLPAPARTLFALGSRSPRARRQLEMLREAFPEVPCLPAFSPAGDHKGCRECIIVPGVPADRAASAKAVAAAMAEAVAAARGEARGVLLFLCGGDIALAVLERLGGDYIELAGEWRPGVPLGHVNGDAERPVMTKAGGFGPEDLLVQLLAGIRHSSKA